MLENVGAIFYDTIEMHKNNVSNFGQLQNKLYLQI